MSADFIKELGERPVYPEDTTLGHVTDEVSRISENPAPRGWWMLFIPSVLLTGVLFAAISYLVFTGVGAWGNNHPVGWAWDITNFVWWIGIGHAGTLISAILYLFRQKWRTSINRFAEAMTIFAVMQAGLFPAIHTGRPWFDYYMFPVPNQMGIWPNFKSPLMWDVFAVSTYFTISLIFWYVGLIPDLATLRDRAKTKARRLVYGFFALGWRGSVRHWQHYERAYLILAAISTPLVLSVHSVVSFDFATAVLPGWHTTIFPPYFVAGAVYSGFALVLTLLLVARTVFKLQDLVSIKHLELMNKFMLATGCMVGYAYAMEFFIAWYSGNEYEMWVFFHNRAALWEDAEGNIGPYWWAYYIMFICNVIVPQTFWSKRLRTSIPWMFVASILINVGMWFERFVIIVTSLSRDFLPSAWHLYWPTVVDICTFVGTLGFFMTLFLLFIRWVPPIAMAEVKAALPHAQPHHEPEGEAEESLRPAPAAAE